MVSIRFTRTSLEVAVLLAGIVTATLISITGVGVDSTHAEAVLRTVATAQASILAIVFSVTLLGVQLVSNRYSPRMTSLIISADQFRFTFLAFVLSVGLDLLLILSLSFLSHTLALSGVVIALGAFVAVMFTLWRFLAYVLNISTPEGLLSEYVDSLSPVEYRESVEASIGNPESPHPLQELYTVVMSALSAGEWATANNGLHQFTVIVDQLLEDAVEKHYLHILRDDLSRQYFRTPLEEFLPRIALEAVEIDEDGLAREAVETIQTIATKSIEHNRSFIVSQAATGFGEIIRETPPGKEGDPARNACLSAYNDILVQLAEKPAPHNISSFLSLYAFEFNKLIGRDRDQWVYRQALSDFLERGIKPSLEATLDQYGAFADTQKVDWRSRHEPSEVTGFTPLELLFTYRRYLVEVTMDILGYVDRNGNWPMTVPSFRDGWRKICEVAINSEATDYGLVFCQLYIDLGYLVYLVDKETAASWPSEIARLKHHADNPELVDQAFQVLSEKGMTPVFKQELHHFPLHQEPEGNLRRVYEEIRNPRMEYKEWLKSTSQNSSEHFQEYFADETDS